MDSLPEEATEHFGFKQEDGYSVFPDGIPFESIENQDVRLLATSNGYLACSSISLLVVIPLSDIDSDKARMSISTSNVTQILFLGSKLFVLQDGTLYEASWADGSISLTELNGFDKNIKSFKANSEGMAILHESNSLIWVTESYKRQFSDVVAYTLVDNGRSVAVATFTSIKIVDLNAETELLNPAEDQTTLEIHQLAKDTFFVVFGPDSRAPDDHDFESIVVLKNGTKWETDVAGPWGVERVGTYYIDTLNHWIPELQYSIITLAVATEISTIKTSGGVSKVIQEAEDYQRAQFPLDEEGNDISVVGISLDIHTKDLEVIEPTPLVERATGLPRLWALTQDGKLLTWWVYESAAINNGVADLQPEVASRLYDPENLLSMYKQAELQLVEPETENKLEELGPITQEDKDQEPIHQDEEQLQQVDKEQDIAPDNDVDDKLEPADDDEEEAETDIPPENPFESKADNPFGKTSDNPFGSSSADVFKIPATPKDVSFGSTFGKPAGDSVSLPNKSAQSAFGSSGFGSTSFGNSSAKPAFGSSTFGNSSENKAFGSSGFGSTGFGNSSAKPAFGSSTFGNSSENKAFGTSGFSSRVTSPEPGFGSPSFEQSGASAFSKLAQSTNDKASPFERLKERKDSSPVFGSNAGQSSDSLANTHKEGAFRPTFSSTELKNEDHKSSPAKSSFGDIVKQFNSMGSSVSFGDSPFEALKSNENTKPKIGSLFDDSSDNLSLGGLGVDDSKSNPAEKPPTSLFSTLIGNQNEEVLSDSANEGTIDESVDPSGIESAIELDEDADEEEFNEVDGDEVDGDELEEEDKVDEDEEGSAYAQNRLNPVSISTENAVLKSIQKLKQDAIVEKETPNSSDWETVDEDEANYVTDNEDKKERKEGTDHDGVKHVGKGLEVDGVSVAAEAVALPEEIEESEEFEESEESEIEESEFEEIVAFERQKRILPDILVFSGLEKLIPVEQDESKKLVQNLYQNTYALLEVLVNNRELLGDFIEGQRDVIQDFEENTDLWTVAESRVINEWCEREEPVVKSKLKQLKDLELTVQGLIKQAEESFKQKTAVDHLMAQLAVSLKVRASEKDRPLEYNMSEARTRLRKKFNALKAQRDLVTSKLMILKASVFDADQIAENTGKVLFTINERIMDHLSSFDDLKSQVDDLKVVGALESSSGAGKVRKKWELAKTMAEYKRSVSAK